MFLTVFKELLDKYPNIQLNYEIFGNTSAVFINFKQTIDENYHETCISKTKEMIKYIITKNGEYDYGPEIRLNDYCDSIIIDFSTDDEVTDLPKELTKKLYQFLKNIHVHLTSCEIDNGNVGGDIFHIVRCGYFRTHTKNENQYIPDIIGEIVDEYGNSGCPFPH